MDLTYLQRKTSYLSGKGSSHDRCNQAGWIPRYDAVQSGRYAPPCNKLYSAIFQMRVRLHFTFTAFREPNIVVQAGRHFPEWWGGAAWRTGSCCIGRTVKGLKKTRKSRECWLLYLPPGLKLKNSTFCPHSVFMCFVWIWEKNSDYFTVQH